MQPRLVNQAGQRRAAGFLLAVIVVMALALVGYGQLLGKGRVLYSPHSDFVAAQLATKTVLYRAVHEQGRIPFWREDELSGNAALTSPVSLYTYPLHFLFYLVPAMDALGPTMWLHFVAAAGVMYLLGAALALGAGARLLLAVAGLFQLKLILAAYAGWVPVLPTLVFFPSLFASVFYLGRRPGLGATLAVAGSVALCLHTEQLQFFYYCAGFLGTFMLWQAIGWWREGRWLMIRPRLLGLLCGGLLGVGITAYLLVPLAAEAPLISRSRTTYGFFLAGHALHPAQLLTFFYPEALGTPLNHSYPGDELWEDVAYFGLVPLLLAGAGAVLGWRRPPTRFLLFGFFLSLLLTMDTPLLRLLYYKLPLFGLFRGPGRFLFLSAFFGLALAGIGLDQLLARLRARDHGSRSCKLLLALLVLAVSSEGVYYSRRYLQMLPQEQVLPHSDYASFLGRDPALFRVASLLRPTINYGWSASLGLQLIGGFDSFNYRAYQQYFDLLRTGRVGPQIARVWTDLDHIARADLLDALNVKYLVAPFALQQLPPERFELAARFDSQPVFVFYEGLARHDLYIYRNKQSRERAFWADSVVNVLDESEMIAAMQQQAANRTAVVLNSDPTTSASLGFETDWVRVVEFSGGRLRLRTSSHARRFLVISEVWHPGWRATLDGQAAPVYRADVALMGTWIPAGEHELELRFRPLYWPVALSISLACTGVFLLLFAAWLSVNGLFRGRTNFGISHCVGPGRPGGRRSRGRPLQTLGPR